MTPPHAVDGTTGRDGTDLLPPGHRVGRWEVVAPIGSGGWATVYAGRPAGGPEDRPDGASRTDMAFRTDVTSRPDGASRLDVTSRTDAPSRTSGADVALKIMPTAGLAPRQARGIVESARREVELGRRAGHPRLIGLLDSFVLSAPDRPSLDGAIVLVMERAERSLRDLIDAGVPEADRGRIVEGICEGLAHLHRSGWVHADLKPENVLLGGDGSVKLSDFGLATELTGTHGHVPPMGTLDYLPPERWRAPLGELGVRIRPSADVWALGIVVHELFASGVPPFPGATPVARGAAVQAYGEGRAPLRTSHALPPFWRAFVTDCLAPTHAARAPHTAESLLARAAARPEERETAAGRPRGRRTRAVVLAAALCGTAGATLWSDAVRGGVPAPQGGAATPYGTVRVFNAERGCQDRTDRDPQCSLGLAVDPRSPYTADNVVPTRVWHGDLLTADCQVPDGEPVVDEEDLRSTRWFRVRLPYGSEPSGAWLPAVRTKDRPALPRCAETRWRHRDFIGPP